jgi:hypothetical protein
MIFFVCPYPEACLPCRQAGERRKSISTLQGLGKEIDFQKYYTRIATWNGNTGIS